MLINLQDVKKHLRSLYDNISLSDEEYLKKKSKEFNLKLELHEVDTIKVGETKGVLKTLLFLLDD